MFHIVNMGIRKYIAKAKEYKDAYNEVNVNIAKNRLRYFERSINDGSLERFLKVATPVSIGISVAGIITGNNEIAGLGYGALLMSGIYWIAIPKK